MSYKKRHSHATRNTFLVILLLVIVAALVFVNHNRIEQMINNISVSKADIEITDYEVETDDAIILCLQLQPIEETDSSYLIRAQENSLNEKAVLNNRNPTAYLLVQSTQVANLIKNIRQDYSTAKEESNNDYEKAKYEYEKFTHDNFIDMLKGTFGVDVSYDKYQKLIKEKDRLEQEYMRLKQEYATIVSYPQNRILPDIDIDRYIKRYINLTIEEQL